MQWYLCYLFIVGNMDAIVVHIKTCIYLKNQKRWISSFDEKWNKILLRSYLWKCIFSINTFLRSYHVFGVICFFSSCLSLTFSTHRRKFFLITLKLDKQVAIGIILLSCKRYHREILLKFFHLFTLHI